jgi:hypothetical protein
MAILDVFKRKQKPVVTPEIKATKEDFINGADWLRSLAMGAVGGVKSKFVSDIYKERILYPHEEMLLAKKAYRYNSYINSAARTRANFMVGGKIEIVSKDEGTVAWGNKTLIDTGLSQHAQDLAVDLVVTGNAYLERINSGNLTVYYDYISFPERMYCDIDQAGLVIQYLQEIPEKMLNVNYGTITYYGDRKKTVKGKLIPKEKIVHFKLGVAEIPAYGRGYVCSVINDYEILNQIERSMAVIARYKAIPKKMIMLNRGDDINGGKAAEAYANQISNLSDIENAVLPEKAEVVDLSYSGQDTSFAPIVDYLKKKLTVSLAPDFIMHGEETNYAVSRDQKEAFILTVNAEREKVAAVIKKELKMLGKQTGAVLQDFEIKFGDFDLGQNEDKKNYAKDLFSSNIITLDEAREFVGLPPAEGDNGQFFNNEMGAASQMLLGGTASPSFDTIDQEADTAKQEIGATEKANAVLDNQLDTLMRQREAEVLAEKEQLIKRLKADLDGN